MSWGFDIEVAPGEWLRVRDHSPESAKSACLAYRDGRESAANVAAKHGIREGTLNAWLQKLGWFRSHSASIKARSITRREWYRNAIEHLYWDKGLSIRQTARMLELGRTFVQDALHAGRGVRTHEEARRLLFTNRNLPSVRRRIDRVCEVGYLRSQGMAKTEIAARLEIGTTTVDDDLSHPANPYRKAKPQT